MAWITLTEPNNSKVRPNVDQMVRIKIPLQGEAPAANAIIDLANNQSQAVTESPDQIATQFTASAALAKKTRSRAK